MVAALLDVSAGLDGDVHRRRAASGHRRHRRKEDHRLLRAGESGCSVKSAKVILKSIPIASVYLLQGINSICWNLG